MSRQDPALPRRQQILDAAAVLFARHGFRGVSIYDIGAAVGISGPALYRHFSSKEAILAEMLVGISERLHDVAVERVAHTRPGVEALAALVDWHVEFALDNPALITVHFRDLDNLAEAQQQHVRRMQRAYAEIWVEAIQAAAPDVDEATARSATHAVFGLINSTPHSARLSSDENGVLLQRMAMAALAAVTGRREECGRGAAARREAGGTTC